MHKRGELEQIEQKKVKDDAARRAAQTQAVKVAPEAIVIPDADIEATPRASTPLPPEEQDVAPKTKKSRKRRRREQLEQSSEFERSSLLGDHAGCAIVAEGL